MYVSHYFLNRSKNGNIQKGRKKRKGYSTERQIKKLLQGKECVQLCQILLLNKI